LASRDQGASDEARALGTYVKLVRASQTLLAAVARRVTTAGLTQSPDFPTTAGVIGHARAKELGVGGKLLAYVY